MHIYKREFSGAEGTQFVMPAGQSAMCFEIGFPPEGRITRFIIGQSPLDGGPVGFTANLLDRQVCELCPEASCSEDIDPMTFELACIIPEQVGVAGDFVKLLANEKGYSYRNREGSFTVPVRKIYLYLTVDDSGSETNWEVAIDCEVGNELN